MKDKKTELPRTFGAFVLTQKLAAGGMADIYLARRADVPEGTASLLVIKMIHPRLMDDKRFVSRFAEEAEILSQLTHENIVSVYEFGQVDAVSYLAMAYVDGVDAATLAAVCRDEGIAIPLAVMLHIGIGTAAALAHAHDAKDRVGLPLRIAHRDVSPENILLSRTGTIQLCDFGLAVAALNAQTDASLSDAQKGKLRYLSPEQAQNGKVDGRSDLFSLGVVLYELAAGHHPVPSGAGVSVLRELAGGDAYPSLREVAPWIDTDIAAVIDRALQFDKTARYQHAQEMRDDLTACLRRYGTDAMSLTADLAGRVQRIVQSRQGREAKDRSSVPAPPIPFNAGIGETGLSAPANTGVLKPTAGRAATALLILIVVAGIAALAAVLLRRTSTESVRTGPLPVAAENHDASNKREIPGQGARRPAGSPASAPENADTAREYAPQKGAVTSGDDAPSPSVSTAPSKADDTEAVAARKPRAFGLVNINAAPWADVEIDGVDYAPTPLLGLKLRAGKHKAVFRNAELNVTKTRVFTVKADETVTVVVEMQSE